nr:unnamed protein product [Callosobruchus chinensis]
MEKLVRKRGSIRASLTIFAKYVDSVKDKDTLSRNEILKLSGKLDRALNLIHTFNDVQEEIDEITDDLDNEMAEREEFDEAFESAIANAKEILEFHDRENNDDKNSAVSSVSAKSSVEMKSSIVLPQINLPKFNGSPENWLEYRATYEALIHENEGLTQMQKYHYLRASLEGTASQVIRPTPFVSESYEAAWKALCEEFDNSKVLVHEHVQALFNLESVRQERASDLKRIVNEVSQHLRCLEMLGEQDKDLGDLLLIYLLKTKLDRNTVQEWEKYVSKSVKKKELDNAERSSLTWVEMKNFLKERAAILETSESKYADSNDKGNRFRDKRLTSKGLVSSSVVSNKAFTCNYCKESHSIYFCKKFQSIKPSERIEYVKKAKLCKICLLDGHNSKSCKQSPCRKCKRYHNTLLHENVSSGESSDNKNQVNDNDSNAKQETLSLATVTSVPASVDQVLLSTAIIFVKGKDKLHSARVLLDSGSQASFITDKLCERLGVKKQRADLSVCGINNVKSVSDYKCKLEIRSRSSEFKAEITCFVLPEITSYTPHASFDMRSFQLPKNIVLADPSFSSPGRVEGLIGGELFWSLIGQGQMSLGIDKPILRETSLGWIIAGQIGTPELRVAKVNVSMNDSISNQIQRFWEIEECSLSKPLSEEESYCENYFRDTTRRHESGRFIVKMPLKQSPHSLGESRKQAEIRLLGLEKRLARNRALEEQYKDFMKEYEDMGHMSLVPEEISQIQKSTNPVYYMPHHAVVREESQTTKLRVVFDASALTTNGLSLNQIQCVGPIVQDDLLAIILRFRLYNVVISADVAKMYRMILIDTEHTSLQKILWRPNSNEPIKEYELETVTYGQACAPYLATRCLVQIAKECEETLPLASKVISRDFYVDDMLTGSDNSENAINLAKDVSRVLSEYGFILRKWQSNDPTFLASISDKNLEHSIVNFDSEISTKILGLRWSGQNDRLQYAIDLQKLGNENTKRSILSSIARIYDPLGLLAPCISLAKIVMQSLWLEKKDWDELVSEEIDKIWKKFKDELKCFHDLNIPRQVICKKAQKVSLHGFSDASQKAYGACIYLVSENGLSKFSYLLCAKSRLAPIKGLTMPRLELLAALLLARLYRKVTESLNINFDRIVLWSDSSIVLAWIKACPSSLKIFVANRIQEIQEITKTCEWRHVPTTDNPADHVSRGLYPSEIINCDLWWQGPTWITDSHTEWPNVLSHVEDLPEVKSKIVATPAVINEIKFPYDKFSNLTRLRRCLAWVLRFKENTRLALSDRKLGPLTMSELENSLIILVKIIQHDSFPKYLIQLRSKKVVNKNSKILSLSPFLDDNGLIRVGGRLKNAPYETVRKHPILLHAGHHITKLLFEHEHRRLLHVGPNSLYAIIRDKFWVVRGRNLARQVTKQCHKCLRFSPVLSKPMMGHLPRDRAAPSSPFTITGVDFAGPFLIRERKGRCTKTSKCYVSLFICFSTKAVHLELVSSLTTEDFILALRRFVSRRGKPKKIYSDNGTNFVGAFRELGVFIASSQSKLREAALKEEISWVFLPPQSPHFGGLWEAGVRSVKHHLRRVLTETKLTFEEFATVIAQIEAILNSRPLCPLSSDPNDYSILSPAHFLIGRSLVAAPDTDYTSEKLNRLNRYQFIQRITQHFWNRWVREFIAELQQRHRWKTNENMLKEGALVLLKDDHTLPTEWRRGRIISLSRGPDNIPRVAEIKTSSGIVRRNFSKLCILPIDPDEAQDASCKILKAEPPMPGGMSTANQRDAATSATSAWGTNRQNPEHLRRVTTVLSM